MLDAFCPGGGNIDPVTAKPGGAPCGLFRKSNEIYSLVTTEATIPDDIDYSHGCTVGDFNNDGFPDLFITCYGQNRLLANNGDGTFTDETRAFGPPLNTWSTGAAFGDVDSDGFSELYVAGYVDWKPDPEEACLGNGGRQNVCSPQRYSPISDLLFFNSGDGRLRNRAEEIGIRNDGMGLGVVAADINRDQKLDFYVANDVVANHLYLNWDGARFAETGESSGVGLNDSGSAEGSMGVDAGDFDGDGQLDLWATNFEMEDNSLYRNLGTDSAFSHATVATGLGGKGRRSVGFGTGLHDLDSDSWPDIYVLNGHVLYFGGMESFRQTPLLFRNADGQRFEDIGTSAGPWFNVPHAARGAAVGDIDNDGDLDMIVSLLDAPVAVLRNRRSARSWIRLRAVGTRSARQAVGTRVTIHCFGRECTQVVKSGTGYLSHSDERLLFALEENAITVNAKVEWPSGHREVFTDLQTTTDHVMIEGHGQQQ